MKPPTTGPPLHAPLTSLPALTKWKGVGCPPSTICPARSRRVVRPGASSKEEGVATSPAYGTAHNNVLPKPKIGQRLEDGAAAPARPSSRIVEKRLEELDERDAYLKNMWYCVALSQDVAQEPKGVEILGKKVVLFRNDDGKVACISDTCPHRGAPLSHGWVDAKAGHSCIVCPYHGWAINGEGLLQDIPAAEKKQDWANMGPVVPSYPVEEKGGFVWLFNGSSRLPAEERPPIPYTPELDDPSWKPVYGEIEFECGHAAVFENAIDMAHIHYLHDDSFGNRDKPEICDMATSTDTFSVTATFTLQNKPVSPLWSWTQVPKVNVTAKAFLPSTSYIEFTLGNGLSFVTFVSTVPISANRTVNRFCLVRKLGWDRTGIFNARVWDRFAVQAMLRILREDKEMVEQLRPEALAREISVKADLPQIVRTCSS